jgi:hypothetical protein
MADYFSAMFRRRPNDGWFRVGRFDLTTTDILCALAAATMFVYGLGVDRWSNLVFFSPEVRDGFDLWRLVSWPIATEPDVWGLLGIIFFWIFGQQLEALFGRDKFLAWVIAVAIVPAAIVTGLGALDSDFDAFQYGIHTLFLCGIWVYAATYPQARWFDVVPLWAIAAVLTLLEVLRYSGNRMTGMLVFLLVAIATALTAARSLGQATGWPIPFIPLADGHRPPARSRSAGRGRHGSGGRHPTPPRPTVGRSGSVVEGPWTAPPPPARNNADAKAAQAELDLLLDKISGSGLDSLTAAEKKRLNELSKQLRG